jgi:putative membrane protein
MSAAAMNVLGDSWGWPHGGGGSWWWIVMMLGMVAVWGAIIALVVWLVRGGAVPRRDTPSEILRRRLAEGAISVEEYEQRRHALESQAPASGDRAPTPPDDNAEAGRP